MNTHRQQDQNAGAVSAEPANDYIISLHAGYENDGAYTDAFLARPADGRPRPGVVLLSAMYGLTWKQREITRLYASHGFVAISPDFMGEVPNKPAAALHAKNSLDIGAAIKSTVGAAAFLRSLPWVGPEGKVGIMGFCVGGGLLLLTLARSKAFQAGIVYHHSLFPDMRELKNISCKLQYHYGTNDRPTPKGEVEAFAKELDRLGKPYELHIYEGMRHGFADVAPDADIPRDRREAAELSYERSFAFLRHELAA